MVLVLFFAFLLFGCTHERDNPYDPHGASYNPGLYPSSGSSLSSSSLFSVLVPCRHAAGCTEISAEACFAFGGQMVASCSESSSSHLLAEVSSSGEDGSSSSMPPVMVLCRLSDGTCQLTLISQEACYILNGTPVQSCAGSIAPSSSSVPTFACAMTATTGTAGVKITPAPAVTCNGSTVTDGLAWTPANLTPMTAGSLAVSVSANSGVCSGRVAQCGSVTVSAPIVACTASDISNGSMTCGGQTYKTVVIGTQTWMAENLNYVVEGSKCYGNDSANCDKYGSLYNWTTAMNLPASCNSSYCSGYIQSKHQGICPSGWHIPSDAEWTTLTDYVGGSSTAGTKLKATSGWDSNGNGTDEYGFSALPGAIGLSDGSFGGVGYNGHWWSADEDEGGIIFACDRYMVYLDDFASWNINDKSNLQSVRCVQD